jgi:hypothetical protein
MTDLWSAAIEEARASAPADVFELETIEILHPAFVDEEDAPDSIRAVLDEREWSLELEADAPLHGGETVLFKPVALNIVRPEQAAGGFGEVQLSIDNVNRALMPHLDAAVQIRATAQLIVRVYLAVRDGDTGEYSVGGPPDEILGELTIRDIDISGTTLNCTARFMDLLSVGFPRRIFSREDFPALFGGDVE